MTRVNSNIHNRRSIRLKGYDYSRAGLYFITICCQGRECLFGNITDDVMIPNDAGKMIGKLWNEISDDFSNVCLHEYVIMPNHFHGIIEINTVGADSISALSNRMQTEIIRADMESAPTMNSAKTNIPKIIQSFKRHTTIKYIEMVKQNILPPFHKRIWQRNYWEHIIRNENEYYRISKYIINNPITWENDKLNGGKGNIVLESLAEYDTEIWMT
ncbi:MAG: hypothetical protein PF692_03320 [Kiritimatiellae bacterium]|jgi:putative transposase|nr:hypothetical protein [Kiritimatiellia bacterium]